MQTTDQDPFHGAVTDTRDGALSGVVAARLQNLEKTLRKQWRLGQNIILCWAPDPRGLLTIVVPHYFLGNFTAEAGAEGDREQLIRTIISAPSLSSSAEIFDVAEQLGVSTSFIRLDQSIIGDKTQLDAVGAMIARYGIGFVNRRAVLLFDIANFSLFTPFEQASQLNSLSYSMNSAYIKLQRQGVDVNFARTTTGDGYYVWNRDVGAYPDLDLLSFLLLVLIDNAVAQEQASGNTVPVIRSAFHVGSHYELFQAEGVNPTVLSYIVGDVTIKLARMLASADAGQVLIGDFAAPLPNSDDAVDGSAYLQRALAELRDLTDLKVAGQPLESIVCNRGSCGSPDPAVLTITDKHGLTQRAMNAHLQVALGGKTLSLGVPVA